MVRERWTAFTLTVLNLKGDVGKTTHMVWLLAVVCQERGCKMLAVDVDTQGNLSRSLLADEDIRHGVPEAPPPAHVRSSVNTCIR